jgi:hypothetical protein
MAKRLIVSVDPYDYPAAIDRIKGHHIVVIPQNTEIGTVVWTDAEFADYVRSKGGKFAERDDMPQHLFAFEFANRVAHNVFTDLEQSWLNSRSQI